MSQAPFEVLLLKWAVGALGSWSADYDGYRLEDDSSCAAYVRFFPQLTTNFLRSGTAKADVFLFLMTVQPRRKR